MFVESLYVEFVFEHSLITDEFVGMYVEGNRLVLCTTVVLVTMLEYCYV